MIVNLLSFEAEFHKSKFEAYRNSPCLFLPTVGGCVAISSS